MKNHEFRFCPNCATPLQWLTRQEDGGDKQRLSCVACEWTHWNNPTPVLAAIIEYRGRCCWRAMPRGSTACSR
jgi:NADH pyrophosphatase NudC (nudix superfamily)